MNDKGNSSQKHISVLASTLADRIKIPRDGIVVDATLGHGGHSRLFGKKLGPEGLIIGIDIDDVCIERARKTLSDLDCRQLFIRENFSELSDILKEHRIAGIDFLLADLGFCSAQMNNVDKGLSFQQEMPLDMRLDSRLTTTAADLVRTLDQESLANLIYEYGEERASRRIARFIIEQRKKDPITTTTQLAAIVSRALHKPQKKVWRKIHPATRTFQALRIAVNGELDNLKQLLLSAPKVLKPSGQIAIISFHSLEDRIVKQNFKNNERDGIYRIITKKPLTASENEISENPRARSAKLRIAEKI